MTKDVENITENTNEKVEEKISVKKTKAVDDWR